MPILVTIATITYLFKKGSKGEASFLAPAALREKVEKLPEGSARSGALNEVDKLDALALQYDSAVDAAMSAYVADVQEWGSSADKIIEEMEPLDVARRDVLLELVHVREDVAKSLTPKEWDKVFG